MKVCIVGKTAQSIHRYMLDNCLYKLNPNSSTYYGPDRDDVIRAFLEKDAAFAAGMTFDLLIAVNDKVNLERFRPYLRRVCNVSS